MTLPLQPPHPLGRCSHCKTPLQRLSVTLARAKVQLEETAEPLTAIVGVESSEVLEAFCMNCGVGKAKEALEQRGISLDPPSVGPWASLCGRCCINVVDHRHSSIVYTIDVEEFDSEAFNVLEDITVVHCCSACEKELNGPHRA